MVNESDALNCMKNRFEIAKHESLHAEKIRYGPWRDEERGW